MRFPQKVPKLLQRWSTQPAIGKTTGALIRSVGGRSTLVEMASTLSKGVEPHNVKPLSFMSCAGSVERTLAAAMHSPWGVELRDEPGT